MAVSYIPDYGLADWLHGFSPQVNYTDRVTAACRQS
jgi:hypothetical protein